MCARVEYARRIKRSWCTAFMFSHHIVIHAHITQPFIIFHTPSQKRGLVLRTLEFDKWIVDDSAVRLAGDVYDASWMPASLKVIWNDTESGGVLHLTLQLVRRLYTEDSPCGRLLRRCLPRRRTWECLDVLKKYQDWSQCASADVSGVAWFGAMTAAIIAPSTDAYYHKASHTQKVSSVGQKKQRMRLFLAPRCMCLTTLRWYPALDVELRIPGIKRLNVMMMCLH